MRIGVSEFVKRQTRDSQFTHYQGSWNDLSQRTEQRFMSGFYHPGYRDGVCLVSMDEYETPLFWTYNDFPMFEGMRLDAICEREKGREYEPPRVQVRIMEPKKRCLFVDVVIYRKDVLEEDGDKTTGADWDIVSINGRLTLDPTPMDPLTIVRNWKHLPGGTEMKGRSAEEVLEMLCQSILHRNGIKLS